MKKQYRIINVGKGILNITVQNLHEVGSQEGSSMIIDSGVYTPSIISSSNVNGPSSLPSTYIRIGDIVTARINLAVSPGYITADVNTSITFTLPVDKINTSIRNIGNGITYSSNSEYWAGVAQTVGATTNQGIFYFRPTTTTGGNIVINIQYSLT